jgi:D-beta-D-heptose 7-phosphate kinase/D-beta-D-heptose 1-phosphate adenosyltransferase
MIARSSLDTAQMRAIITGNWRRLHVLVVGDVMLDRSVHGVVERISPEAPVPVVRLTHRSHQPGGAANVAMNLASLGAQASVVGFTGEDDAALALESSLQEAGVHIHLVSAAGRRTTVKQRILGAHGQLLRVDEEDTTDYPSDACTELLGRALTVLPSMHAVVLSDYAKGAIPSEACRALIDAARKQGIPVLVDPKHRDLSRYRGATTICPNRHDLSLATGIRADDTAALLAGAVALVSTLDIEFLTVTLSEQGIALVTPESTTVYPAALKQARDVTGAGDTVIATLALCIASSLLPGTAALIANLAAGIVVAKSGTVTASCEELLAAFDNPKEQSAPVSDTPLRKLQNRVALWRASGERIVFTNGCFDLLHVGHITLLETARRMGDRLVVAINSDDSVRALKGSGRPLVNECDRARILAALTAVDAVILFDELTPIRLIAALHPDILVKGGDYSEQTIVGAEEVRGWGGEVRIVPLIEGYSTTRLITGCMIWDEAKMDVTRSRNTPANWAGNYSYRSREVLTAGSIAEVRNAVGGTHRLHALGTRHAFNSIADAEDGVQISVEPMNELQLDAASALVTVGGGVTYAHLGPWLDAQGWALPNLASLPHISIAGATQTGTHGSGTANGNLSAAVEALEMVTADGQLRRVSRSSVGERFDGMVVACGALGVITSLTLRIVPSFSIRQMVYQGLPIAALRDCLEQVFASGYSVSLFTGWQSRRIDQIWVKERVDADSPAPQREIFGALSATREMHPLPGHDAQNCTLQLGIPGPWYERLPHFRSEFTPSSGNEIQTEYFVPLEHGFAAIEAVAALGAVIAPQLLVSELRTIAADALWLSPCYRRRSLAFHFTWKRDWSAVRHILPLIEAALAPFDARPHWAKAFTMEPSRVQALYPRMMDFHELAREFDPEGRFRNNFLNRYIFAG